MSKQFPVSLQTHNTSSEDFRTKGSSFLISAIWPFVLSLALVFLVAATISILGQGVRATLSSEARWTQSRHLAVDALGSYLESGTPHDYAAFLSHLKTPLALTQAREATLNSKGDENSIRAALLAGGVHPDDVMVLSWMLRNANLVKGAQRAMDHWRHGDASIEELRGLGRRAQARYLSGNVTPEELRALKAMLKSLDLSSRSAEAAFRQEVEATARQVSNTLLLAGMATCLALMFVGIYFARHIVGQRFQADASAQRARERLEMATLSANDGIWDWHLHNAQIFWTPRVAEMLGYDNGPEFKGFIVREQIHPEEMELVMQRLREHLLGLTQRMEFDLRFLCRDNNYRWFKVRGMRICDASNEPVRVLGTITDIHSHTLAQQSLRTAWHQAQRMAGELELALDGADVALWAYEPATGNVLHHRRWNFLLGRESMPRTFEGWLQLTHADDRRMRVRLLEDHLLGKSTYYESEFRMLHADGSWVWVRSRGRATARDPNGRALQYAGAVMNISTQVEAREVQRRESEFLQAMIRGVDLGVMISNFDSIVFANRSLAKLLDYDHEETLSQEALVKLMPASDRSIDIVQKHKATSGQVIPARVANLKTRAHRRIKVVMNLSCVDWNGEPHFISTVSPLAEHADLEIHLRSAEERFERAVMSELEGQQATIARELHDSLGSILTGVSLLLRSARNKSDEMLRSATLEQAQGQIQAAAEMTRAMARGIMPVGTHPGALVQALEQFVHDLEELKGIHAEFVVNGNFGLVPAEVGNHVYRVVQEATTNAIKHGQANKIHFTLLENATLFVMRIEDNGKGMSLSASDRQTQGLGIRSMQARAKVIRGALKMESRTDRGYCVELSWPLPHQTTVRPADPDEGASSQ